MNYGEIIDRYTINYLKHCEKNNKEVNPEHILELVLELLELNMDLWNLEDAIRDKNKSLTEAGKIGREIAKTNDLRNKIKNEINKLIGNNNIEEKIYKN